MLFNSSLFVSAWSSLVFGFLLLNCDPTASEKTTNIPSDTSDSGSNNVEGPASTDSADSIPDEASESAPIDGEEESHEESPDESTQIDLVGPLELFNGDFELGGEVGTNWTESPGWSGTLGGVSNDSYFSPVSGSHYAFVPAGDDWITQELNGAIEESKTYRVKLYACSINPPGVQAKTEAEVEVFSGETVLASLRVDVSAPRLKGTASTHVSDDYWSSLRQLM